MNDVTVSEPAPAAEATRRSLAIEATRKPTGEEHVIKQIRPVKRRVPVGELWQSWAVAWVVAQRDIKVKYKQSILGRAWLVLQPLGVLAGLVFVFNGVTKVNTGDVPYVLFALASLSAWNAIQQTISVGTNIFVLNSFLVRRLAFPRSSLFTAAILGNAFPGLVIFVFVFAGLIVDRGLPLQVLVLPLLVVWLGVFMAGVLFIVSSLTVRFRDLYALVPFWLQIGMFVTPVGYPLHSAPGHLKTVLAFNPLSGLLELWRWSLLGLSVEALPIITAAVGTVLLAAGGWYLFTRMEVGFADFI